MSQALKDAVKTSIASYLESLDGEKPAGMHKMVVGEVGIGVGQRWARPLLLISIVNNMTKAR